MGSFRISAVVVVFLASCGASPEPSTADANPPADSEPSWPPPRDDMVPPVGSDGAVDIATWNIENFPMLPTTPSLMADLITSLRIDLVAVQEIADISSFDELVGRLPDHEGILSTHSYGTGSYQKVGFIYRADILELADTTLLFTSEGYLFPRPPLAVTVTVDDGIHPPFDFTVITVHLKAGFDADDRERRADSIVMLESYVNQLVAGAGDDEVLVLGDFNEVIASASGREVMSPWLDGPDDYLVHTEPLAEDDQASFIPSDSILDHVISTPALDDEFAGGAAQIPLLHVQYSSYEIAISDHLPVVVSMPVLE